MDIGSILEKVLLAVILLAVLGGMFLLGYPSLLPLGRDRSESERAVKVEVERRHHYLVNRGMSASFAVIAGGFAIAMLADSSKDRSAGLVMAAMSITSLTVFVLLIRRGRRLRRSRQLGGRD